MRNAMDAANTGPKDVGFRIEKRGACPVRSLRAFEDKVPESNRGGGKPDVRNAGIDRNNAGSNRNSCNFDRNIAGFNRNIGGCVIEFADFVNNVARVVIEVGDFLNNIGNLVIEILNFYRNIGDVVIEVDDFCNKTGDVAIPGCGSGCPDAGRASRRHFQYHYRKGFYPRDRRTIFES